MEKEVQGDFSNFKGSVYHFRYALRILLTAEAEKVWFYEGNDLLARPVSPVVVGEDDLSTAPIVSIAQRVNQRDVWIQLKYTDRPWTASSLLDGNLLRNFICNAVHSRRQQREWEARLVTPAPVDPHGELSSFVQKPETHGRNYRKLVAAVSKARKDLTLQGASAAEVDTAHLQGIALEVLRQLADSIPTYHETLTAEIGREIAFDYPDPRAVKEISNQLLGAMVRQAGAGPDQRITYDAEWLARVSGRSIGTRSLLSTDRVRACETSIARSLPRNWVPAQYVPRPRLQDALDRFLESSETAFVLIGATGSGKSWAVAHWTLDSLNGQVRLFIKGYELNGVRSPDELIARKLEDSAPSNWGSHDFAKWLVAIRVTEPVTLIIDGLEVGPTGAEGLRQKVASIVDRCHELGFKVVMTARDTVWDLYHLYQEIPASRIFRLDRDISHASFGIEQIGEMDERNNQESVEGERGGGIDTTVKATPDVFAGPSNREHSYVLEGYTDQELAEVLAKRLNTEQDDDLIRKIATPYFVALRTPFLLDLYINQHGGASTESLGQGAPFAVDTLLDQRIQQSLERIALRNDLQPQEMRTAFDALSSEFWVTRSQGGLPRSSLVRCLDDHLHSGIGVHILNGLMTEGLVTFNAAFQLADPIVTERIFATRLLRAMQSGAFVVDEVDPESDTGTVAAMLRAQENPAALATQLLEVDKRWRRAVCSGIAQGNSDDFRVLAILTSIARTDSGNLIPVDAAESLGYLAARSRTAWKWIARLYLGDWSFDRMIAERALALTANLVPTQVAALIRVQLHRAAKLNPYNAIERKERDRLLNRSLAPFLDLQNQSAAQVALRLLDRYDHLVRVNETTVDHRYLRDVDAVRGIAALALGRTELDAIIDDLRSPQELTRYRAARALKPVALDQPPAVAEAISQAIAAEEHPDVLNELLWSAHRIATVQPEQLLDAFEASKAADWMVSSRTAGTALALLSDLSDHLPDRLFQILPRDFDSFDPRDRALHAEALAFVWWSLAESSDEARSVLDGLAKPDLDGLAAEYQVFALRGAAIAQLGLICLASSVPSHELLGWHNMYSGMGRQFVFVWTDQFVERHASELVFHSAVDLLFQTLKHAIVAEDAQEIDPLQRDLSNSAFLAANLCLEMLIHLSAGSADPLAGAQGLPRGRQTLYFARKLLELGKANREIVEFALKACEETESKNSVTTSTDERERCLAMLAALNVIPDPTLSMQGSSRLLHFGGRDKAELVAQICARAPERFLPSLHDAIAHPDDLPTLYNLNQYARRWDQLLVAEVYARMFDSRPMSGAEAKCLVTMMIQSIESMPHSPIQQEYQAVYSAIAAVQSDRTAILPTISMANDPLQRSHQWAMEILDYHQQSIAGVDVSWFSDTVCDQRSWWSNPHLRLVGDVTRSFQETLYMFPAIRLALVAIGRHYGEVDPGGKWLAERASVTDFLDKWRNVLGQQSDSRDDRAKAYRAFQNRADEEIRDERFWANYGLVALFNDNLDAAERFLEKAVNTKWASESTTASALYNLACAYSRQRRSEDSKEALTRCFALAGSSQYNSSLASDSDFDNVRGQPWFVELMAASDA